MFTPQQLEAMPVEMEQYFKELESRVMSDIVRRIKINSEITRSADWQIYRLQELGTSQKDIKSYIAKTLNMSDKEVDKIYDDVIPKGYAHDESLYKSVGKEIIPFSDNSVLQQLITATSLQTKEEFKNITQSLGFAVQQGDKLQFTELAKYYQKTLDGAILDITSGAFDYNTVIKRVISEMTASGLRTVDYASGWSNRVDVAARRALITGVNQVTAKINDQNAEELDTDYFEVSYHLGARPSHQVWQGKVYSRDELERVCGLGTGSGLCGWNCYHSYSPFIPGVSERTYTDEQLADMNAKENEKKLYIDKEFTIYEAIQKQRRTETSMRVQRQKIKLMEEAGINEDDIINDRCRYRGTSQEYVRFSTAMGLPQQRDRVYGDNFGKIGVGKTKIDLTNKDYNDILYMKGKMSNRDARKWYIAHNNKIPDLIDTSLPIESQARQACKIRNKHKLQARELMADQEERKRLDKSDPIISFEELIKRKMEYKNLSREEAVNDILKTATKTRKSVNKQLGLEV